MIEAGSQLVDRVTKRETALVRWCKDVGWPGVRLPLKSVMNDDGLSGLYRGFPTKENVLEVTEVLLGPVDLQLRSIKSVAHIDKDCS
jgi:hypothetical protein